MNTQVATAQEFVIARTLHASRDLVWNVWTDVEHLQHWFGPTGVTIGNGKLDFRVGGTYHYSMQTPGASLMWGRMVFEEITPKERIVWINSFSDPNGGLTRPPFDGAWPAEILTTATFEEHDGQTTVIIRWEPLNASVEEVLFFNEVIAGMNEGWSGTFERLEAYLHEVRA